MKTNNLKITLLQTDIIWEDSAANLALIESLLDKEPQETDIIVLPEMFNTGFSTQPEPIAESMNGEVVGWMKNQADRQQADLVGSAVISDGGCFYNRLLWVTPQGELNVYDKKYLFSMAGENNHFVAGQDPLTVTRSGWRLRTFICYDLRFPEWMRNHRKSYDVAVVVANWPAKRVYHWISLLIARAIENQIYVIGVNRVGIDGNGIAYSGDSLAIDPLGKIIWQGGGKTDIHMVSLSLEVLEDCRASFPVWADA